MNDKTIELINRMAEKLGTTAEHLWGVLVKQAVIGAYANITAWALACILCFAALALTQKKARYDFTNDELTPSSIIFALCVMGAFGLLVLAAFEGSSNLTRIMNPEYWALTQILP